MLHVTWVPPDVYEPEYRDLLTHYRVTIAPVDAFSMKVGVKRCKEPEPALSLKAETRKNYTVMVPGNSIR